MGKTRDLFKKIKDTNRIFYAKMDSIKDGNSRNLTEVEDNKNRWQEYTEEVYKNNLHKPDNHDGVITHLRSNWSIVSFNTCVSLLMFCLVDLSIGVSGVLRSPQLLCYC